MSSLLLLGGTSWLGGQIAAQAADAGHAVTCLARGESGPVPPGVELVSADRSAPGAYDPVAGRRWDAVIDVSRQPGHVRSAVAALGPAAALDLRLDRIGLRRPERAVERELSGPRAARR
jgi:2'-hydroxyisoflavone reductase